MLNNQAIWLTKLIFEPKPKSKTIKLLEMTEPISCFFGYAISCFYPHAGISTIAQSSVLTYCIFNIRNYFSMPRCGWAQLCRALSTFFKKKKKKNPMTFPGFLWQLSWKSHGILLIFSPGKPWIQISKRLRKIPWINKLFVFYVKIQKL